MKRILAIVLMLCMILPLVPTLSFGAAAAETPRFTFDISTNDTLNVGDTVTVTVGLKNAPAVKALSIMPDYDKTKLQLTAGNWTSEFRATRPMMAIDWDPAYLEDQPVAAFDNSVDVNGVSLITFTFTAIAEAVDTKVGVTAWVYGYDESTHDEIYIFGEPDNGYDSIEGGDYAKIVICNHAWDNACDATCNTCGYVRSVSAHKYDNACDATCNTCGYVRSVSAHKYDNACDVTCNVCGYTRVAPHNYKTTWEKDADSHWYECADCGAKKNAAKHAWDKGVLGNLDMSAGTAEKTFTCTACGAQRVETVSVYRVTVSNESAKVGETVTVDISFAETAPLKSAVVFGLVYDKSALELVSGKWIGTDAAAIKDFNMTDVNGVIAFNENTVASDLKLTLTFKVLEGTKVGDYEIGSAANATYMDGIVEIPYDTFVTFGGIKVGHDYKTTWDHNADSHWHTCAVCGDIKDEAAHIYDNACDTDCNECGYVRTITHSYKTTWDKDADSHWHTCAVCGDTKDEAAHIYDNACDTDCNECGYVRTITHSYKTTWDKDADSHWHTCAVCGDIKDESAHIYDNACDTDCNECGYERVAPHSYETAWSHDADSHWHACLGCSANKDKAAHVWDKGVLGAVNWQNGTADKHFACTVCEAEKTEQVSVYRVTVESKTALVGTEFTVDVSFTETTPIKSAAVLDLVYDKTALELVGGKWVGADDAVIANFNMTDVNGVIAFDENTVASGLKLTLTFKALESAEVGEYTLSCSANVGTLDGTSEIYLDSVVSEGKLTLVKYKRGDVNGDDKVDSNDAIYLLRYTLMPEKYPINQSGDMNGDGKTDSNDAIYLLRHTLMPEKYPLK